MYNSTALNKPSHGATWTRFFMLFFNSSIRNLANSFFYFGARGEVRS
jgi:hypothetical protein